jgi:hypothetical protein
VRSRTLQSLSSFTHLTWVSLVGVSLSEDSLPPALATHVPKLQGLTLIRVVSSQLCEVSSTCASGKVAFPAALLLLLMCPVDLQYLACYCVHAGVQTRAHRAGVQSPPTPGQGGDGGAEGSEKQARPLITSLPSQLQHLEVEEVTVYTG